MTLNPIKWIEWLINEHGSSTVLRERLGQAKDQISILERENTALKQEMQSLKAERDDLRARLEKAAVEIDHLKQENKTMRDRGNYSATLI